ncbi:MAG: TIGR00645 family protein [Nitrospirota bacterium]|nr:TIGR00645 family protein [Nitrospirota bacterium]
MSNGTHHPITPVPSKKLHSGPLTWAEDGFEKIVFASRWIQAPLYGGLIVAELLYAYKFMVELWHMTHDIGEMSETVFMLGVLSLVDITMVANLLTMVVIGGYVTFVSKLDLEGNPDKPEWLSHVDPGTIKVKLATSLIGVSSVHLLKVFVNISNTPPEQIKWRILIHLTFLGTAFLLAWTDNLMRKPVTPDQPVHVA